MPRAWRLTKTRYLAAAWDGEGARRNGGRWNGKGTTVVYTSATLSLALLETLVHLPSAILPAFSAVTVDFDDSLVEVLEEKALSADWRSDPVPVSTQALGDAWVREARSVALRVPSVVVPMEFNYVLNPGHLDFARIAIGKALPFPFDARLPLP